MEILTQFGTAEQSMTSLEIAELVQKRHDNVKRTIENLIQSQVIACPQIEDVHNEVNGRVYTGRAYVFSGEKGKRDSIVVVAQLCPEFTARLVDRWQELEQKNTFDITNPAHLLQAIEIQAKQNIALKQELEIQAPKVAFVDKYVAGNGNKTFRQVAKLLQIKENKFRDFLESNRIMYKLNGEWTAYQNHVDAKRFHVKTGVSDFGHNFNHALFTPKGVEWIAGELAKAQIRVVAA